MAVSPWEQAQEWMSGLSRTMPGFESLRDGSGRLQSQFTLEAAPDVGFTSNLSSLEKLLSGINLNTQGLEALRGRALATGQSPWASMMLEKQGLEEAGARDRAAMSGNVGIAQAMSSLATRGGASRGARERIATKGAQSTMQARNAVARQGQLDRLGIMATDENQKLDLLKMLPGAEVQALQPGLQKASMWTNLADSEAGRRQQLDLSNRDYKTNVAKTNLQTLISDRDKKMDYEMAKFKELMAGYGAERTAQAQEESGGISWLCTEVHRCEPLTVDDWKALRKLRRHAWKTRREETKDYLDGADGLLAAMKDCKFDFSGFRPFVLGLVQLVKSGKLDAAVEAYSRLVEILKPFFGVPTRSETLRQAA